MKSSITFAFFILAIGLAAGFTQLRELSALRQDREKLSSRAVKPGVLVESSGFTGKLRVRSQHDPRKDPVHSVVAQIISCGREIRDFELNLEEPPPHLQIRICNLKEQLMDLDPEEMKRFVEGLLRQEPQPDGEQERRQMIGICVRMMAADHPDAALLLLTGSPELKKLIDRSGDLMKSSLARWAKKDPAAALAWTRRHSEATCGSVRNEMFANALSGAAQTDPAHAFKLLAETEVDQAQVIGRIAEAAPSPESRTAVLAAFRTYLTSVGDPEERDSLKERVLAGFVESLGREDFATATGWIAAQNLSAEDCDELVRELPEEATIEQPGEWIEWMADSLPPGKLGERVERLIGAWATKDCIEVGEWLGQEPEGPARTAAVGAYAKTLAGYDPQSAAKWAMTMPAGQERQDTLKSIHRNWPAGDSAARVAFAREHGIAPDSTGRD